MPNRQQYYLICVGTVFLAACPCSCYFAQPLAKPSLPPVIEENLGQADPAYRYYASRSGLSALFDDKGLTIDVRGEAVRLELEGDSRPAAGRRAKPEDERLTRVNYFVGQDASRWIRNVRTFGRVRYSGVYLGIDMVFHGSVAEGREIEQDFEVAAGADPRRIRMRFAGARQVEAAESGDLLIRTATQTISWKKPSVYQMVSRRRVPVEARYRVQEDNSVGFELGRYDGSKPMVIDPVIAFATYTGSAGNDGPGRVATDAQGNVYIAGSTNDPTFPVSPGGFTRNTPGAYNLNATVTKMNASGTQAMFTTHFGGSVSTFGSGIAVDSAGNIYLCGGTTSPDFPVTPGAIGQSSRQGDEMGGFVAKLNASGNQLLYGTYLDGSRIDFATSIIVDTQGNAYVAGVTNSNNFPATPDSFQPSFRASGTSPGFDGFITKLNPQATRLVYSTFLGGSGNDIIWGLALDSDGSVYAAGNTSSTNFPVTARAARGTYSGGSGRNDWYYTAGDGFAAKLSADGSTLRYATYIGGRQDDAAMSIAIDPQGNAYVGGSTLSTDFPVTNGAWQTAYRGSGGENTNPSGDGFVTKINPDGTAFLYSTLAGGTRDDRIWSLSVEPSTGAVWAAGHTLSRDFPVTADAAQKTYAGDRAGEAVSLGDAFILRLNPAGSGATYATYHGGAGNDVAVGLTIARDGSVVVAGVTSSANLPVTPGVYQNRGRGGDTQGSPVLDTFLLRLNEPPAAPVVSVSSVVNEASGNGGAVSPGLRVRITGQNLVIDKQTTQVLFGGLQAVVFSATTDTIVAAVPYAIAPQGDAPVTSLVVDAGGNRSQPVTIPVASVFPGIYAATVANEDGSLNSADTPAAAGSLVSFVATGEGQTDPPGEDGKVADGDALPVPVTPVVVAVGDQGVEVVSAQAVAGEPAGKIRVTVRIPGDLPAGEYALVLLMGDAQSQGGVRVVVSDPAQSPRPLH